MPLNIRDEYLWAFGQLYSIVANFADRPENVISRIGGGRISIPDDQSVDLCNFRQTILEHYPDAAHLEIIRITGEIDAILSRHDPDDWFWSNKGFLRHDDWLDIRELARNFLLR